MRSASCGMRICSASPSATARGAGLRHSVETGFAPDHPACDGHFPGDPIVPGALLLAEVLERIAAALPLPLVVRSAKFLRPVRPGERLVVQWERVGTGDTRFDCIIAGTKEKALSGSLSHGAETPLGRDRG
jgi:3-hydroxyacyl-[acyl-carrier-protein] dehydratase